MALHTLNFSNDDPLTEGEFKYVDGPDSEDVVDFPTASNPADATWVSLNYDLGELSWAIRLISHIGRGFGGYGIAGQRNFNPDMNGSARPLPKSAYLQFSSIGGNKFTLKSAYDAQDISWHDWKFNQGGHPLDGQPIHSPIQPGDWIEIDPITAQQYFDEDGISRILVAPGINFLVVDVDYGSGIITVHEPNVPTRDDTSWEIEGRVLDGWLWRMVQEPAQYDAGPVPLFKPSAIGVNGEYTPNDDARQDELNIETRICRHDRFCFANFDHMSDPTFDDPAIHHWIGDYQYLALIGFGPATRPAKTCFAIDVLNRVDRGDGGGGPLDENAPIEIYPEFRREYQARFGLEGPLDWFCGGGATDNGGVPQCTRFQSRLQPNYITSSLRTRMREMINGLEVVGRQDFIGFPWISYFYSSPPSLAGIYGHWWPTAGGADLNIIIILSITGGWFGIVDQRADSGGSPVGSFGSWFRRPKDEFDRATAIALSSCARFLGSGRKLPRTGGLLSSQHLDIECDVTDGVNMNGYSSSGIFTHEANFERQIIHDDTFMTIGRRKILVQILSGQRDVKILSSFVPVQLGRSGSGQFHSGAITSVSGNEVRFTAAPATPYAEHIIGHFPEWFEKAGGSPGKHPNVWHNDIKHKVQVRDVAQFAAGTAPTGFAGHGLVVATAVKDTVAELDKITLYASSADTPGSIVTPDGTWVGKTLLFFHGRTRWLPSTGDVVVKIKDTGDPIANYTTLTPGDDYEVCAGGCDENEDGSVDWHIKLTDGPTADSDVLVQLNRAILTVNLKRGAHLEEARAMAKNATTAQIDLGGGGTISAVFYKVLWWSAAGENHHDLWWTFDAGLGSAPGWGPNQTGPDAMIGGLLAGGAGVDWTVRNQVSVPIRENVQMKGVSVPVFTLPDNLHVSGAGAIVEAYIWITATKHASSDVTVPAVAAAIVRKPRIASLSGEDGTTCMNERIGGGECAQPVDPGPFWSNPMRSDLGFWLKPGQWPIPESPTWIGAWMARCLLGQPKFRSDLWGRTNMLASELTWGFCGNNKNGPYCSTRIWTGSTFEQETINHMPTDTNVAAQLVRCDKYVSSVWGPPEGAFATVPADGAAHKLDLTQALKNAVATAATERIGIAVAPAAALSIVGGGSTGDWTGWEWLYGPDHPLGDPGGEDEYDKEPVYVDPPTADFDNPIHTESVDLTIHGPLVVVFQEIIQPNIGPMSNLPGIAVPP